MIDQETLVRTNMERARSVADAFALLKTDLHDTLKWAVHKVLREATDEAYSAMVKTSKANDDLATRFAETERELKKNLADKRDQALQERDEARAELTKVNSIANERGVERLRAVSERDDLRATLSHRDEELAEARRIVKAQSGENRVLHEDIAQRDHELSRLRLLVNAFLRAYSNTTETGFKERIAAIDDLTKFVNGEMPAPVAGNAST